MVKKSYILVCGGTACEASKADAIYESFKKILEDEGLKNDVQVVKTGCFGFCEKGPIVKILLQQHAHSLQNTLREDQGIAIGVRYEQDRLLSEAVQNRT